MSGPILTPLSPFGLEARDAERLALDSLDPYLVAEWVATHRVTVLRGCSVPDDAFVAFGRSLGTILEWDFGAINELRVRDDARNYLYTTSAVPFHWDGAFVGRIPRYIVFHCVVAPARGGETLFADTVRLLEHAPPERRATWGAFSATYATEKIAHYGGRFTSPLVVPHPLTGVPTLRFAEPVHDLNPVTVEVEGLATEARDALFVELSALLRDPRFCYRHVWREGDVVIADNHALLHGRAAFGEGVRRHLRRVNVL